MRLVVKYLYFILILVLPGITVSAGIINFSNGNIDYQTREGDDFFNGKITYQPNNKEKFIFHFSKMTKGQFATRDRYTFVTSEKTTLNLPNLPIKTLLPNSRASLYTTMESDSKITGIRIEYGRFGKADNSFALIQDAIEINNTGKLLLNNWDIELGPLSFSIGKSEEENLLNVWQEDNSDLYFRKDFDTKINVSIDRFIENMFDLDPGQSTNISPTAYASGYLLLSPTTVHGEMTLGFSLFENRIKFFGLESPAFLTKDNPLSIKGIVDYNRINKVLSISKKTEGKSGNLSIDKTKTLKIILDPERFGLSYVVEGNINYDMSKLKKWLDDNPKKNVKDYIDEQNLDIEDWLVLWQLSKIYNNRSELAGYTYFSGKGKLGIRFFYDPEDASQPKDKVDCPFVMPIVEIKLERK